MIYSHSDEGGCTHIINASLEYQSIYRCDQWIMRPKSDIDHPKQTTSMHDDMQMTTYPCQCTNCSHPVKTCVCVNNITNQKKKKKNS